MKFLLVLISVLSGYALWTFIGIDYLFNRLARGISSLALRQNEKASAVSTAFIEGTLLFCIGPMAILGVFRAGLKNDSSILISKGVIDGGVSFALAAAQGVGV